MKNFLVLAVLGATASFGQAQRPDPVPPVRIGLTVGGQGLGVDVTNKTVTVPADWTVYGGRRPPQAPPVRPEVGKDRFYTVPYARAYESARDGQPITVIVGPAPAWYAPAPGGLTTVYVKDAPAHVPPGVYLLENSPRGVLIREILPPNPVTAAPGVAAPARPFGAATWGATRATSVPRAGVVSTSSTTTTVTERTSTGVRRAAPVGPIRRLAGAGLFGDCGPGG